MKCAICGYDDLGTGDSAHSCGTSFFMRATPTLEAERAAFEVAYQKEFPVSVSLMMDKFKRDECGDYNENCVYTAWKLWLAARRAAPVAEGIALPPKQSIDTPEFRELLDSYADADYGVTMGYERAAFDRDARAAKLIAYIDGRTAGAAPDDVVEGLCNTLGEIDALACDGLMPRRSQAEMRMRFKQIINQARPAMLAAAPSQMDKGREGA